MSLQSAWVNPTGAAFWYFPVDVLRSTLPRFHHANRRSRLASCHAFPCAPSLTSSQAFGQSIYSKAKKSVERRNNHVNSALQAQTPCEHHEKSVDLRWSRFAAFRMLSARAEIHSVQDSQICAHNVLCWRNDIWSRDLRQGATYDDAYKQRSAKSRTEFPSNA